MRIDWNLYDWLFASWGEPIYTCRWRGRNAVTNSEILEHSYEFSHSHLTALLRSIYHQHFVPQIDESSIIQWLVNISGIWLSLEIFRTWIIWFATASRTKKCCIETCLNLEKWVGFLLTVIAARLSTNNGMESVVFFFQSSVPASEIQLILGMFDWKTQAQLHRWTLLLTILTCSSIESFLFPWFSFQM